MIVNNVHAFKALFFVEAYLTGVVVGNGCLGSSVYSNPNVLCGAAHTPE